VLPDLTAAPDTDLPVRVVLPEVLGVLRAEGAAVLVAPPGSGKTTLVPLALAGQVAGRVAGRVVVAQPRRIAARSAARRMAALLGEKVGGRVGYTVRGESRTGPATRIEVVTTGVLVRRLQRDPDLPGAGAILLDECHERHLDADLVADSGLAFPAAEPTRGAGRVGDARPDVLDRRAKPTAEDEIVAANAAGGLRGHADSFLIFGEVMV